MLVELYVTHHPRRPLGRDVPAHSVERDAPDRIVNFVGHVLAYCVLHARRRLVAAAKARALTPPVGKEPGETLQVPHLSYLVDDHPGAALFRVVLVEEKLARAEEHCPVYRLQLEAVCLVL